MIFSVIFIFCTLVEMAIVCQLSRWERERQIGSKVLGHWLNQIRKTRKNDGKSNGNEVNGVKKRFLLKPISPSGSPKSERDASLPPPDSNTTNPPTTLSENDSVETVRRSRFANAFRRAATGSPSPHRPSNDVSAITSNVTTPLTNAVGKTSIVEQDNGNDEVQFTTSRIAKWKNFWGDLVQRISRICRPGDREWTLTSIQVDRCSMILFPTAFLIFNLV